MLTEYNHYNLQIIKTILFKCNLYISKRGFITYPQNILISVLILTIFTCN